MKLAESVNRGLGLLLAMPPNREVDLRLVSDPLTALGIGYCVAKGWATYRGDERFKITEAGKLAARDQDRADAR